MARLRQALKKVVRPAVVTCGRPIAAVLAGKPPNKTLSAMVRVKNEEEYLDRAVPPSSIWLRRWSSSTTKATTRHPK